MSHRTLLCALVELAVKDVRYTGEEFALRKQRESARRWVTGTTDCILSFDFCCDTLDINHDAVLDKLSGEGVLRWRQVRRKRRAA